MDTTSRTRSFRPVYGDMHGFPPTILTTGTRDLLLSNTVRVDRKLRRAGVDAVLQVYEGESHAQYQAETQRRRARKRSAKSRRSSGRILESSRAASLEGRPFRDDEGLTKLLARARGNSDSSTCLG
jgi:acetyl esterase/lipase